MNLLRRLFAWWRPTPTTPEEIEALRMQHEANFDQESRRAPRISPMMEGEAERQRRR
jgi:hypothetical protein